MLQPKYVFIAGNQDIWAVTVLLIALSRATTIFQKIQIKILQTGSHKCYIIVVNKDIFQNSVTQNLK